MKSVPFLPLIEVTHVRVEGASIVELGAVINGKLAWRMPANWVIGLYRAGLRFFINRQGKAIEIYVDPGLLQDKPTLRTVGDRVFAPQLLTLPHFA